MNYKDLIQFEPITSVVKLVDSEQTAKAQELVKSYVFSTKIQEDIEAVILGVADTVGVYSPPKAVNRLYISNIPKNLCY